MDKIILISNIQVTAARIFLLDQNSEGSFGITHLILGLTLLTRWSPPPLRIFHSSRIKQSREPKTSRLWSFSLAERILDGLKCYTSTRCYYYYFQSEPFHALNFRNQNLEKGNRWRSGRSKVLPKPSLTNKLSSRLLPHTNVSLLPTASSHHLYEDFFKC